MDTVDKADAWDAAASTPPRVQKEINTALTWMDDLLVRYKEALRLLGKTEAQIGLATFPHRTAIQNLQKLKSK